MSLTRNDLQEIHCYLKQYRSTLCIKEREEINPIIYKVLNEILEGDIFTPDVSDDKLAYLEKASDIKFNNPYLGNHINDIPKFPEDRIETYCGCNKFDFWNAMYLLMFFGGMYMLFKC